MEGLQFDAKNTHEAGQNVIMFLQSWWGRKITTAFHPRCRKISNLGGCGGNQGFLSKDSTHHVEGKQIKGKEKKNK